ncbi:MAG: hypothetical protein ACI4G0_04140 [Ruminococcus sp.]
MIILSILFGATVGVAIMAGFNNHSYDRGFKSGEKAGYHKGFKEGFDVGEEAGFSEGRIKGFADNEKAKKKVISFWRESR